MTRSNVAHPPSLVASKAEVEQKIRQQIEKGHNLRNLPIRSQSDLEKAQAERSKWSSYNFELLARLFSNAAYAEEYRSSNTTWFREISFDGGVSAFRKDIDDSINRLESIKQRISLIPRLKKRRASPISPTLSTKNGIFIVHGHDEAAKQSVARLIEKLDLHPIILDEQPHSKVDPFVKTQNGQK